MIIKLVWEGSTRHTERYSELNTNLFGKLYFNRNALRQMFDGHIPAKLELTIKEPP